MSCSCRCGPAFVKSTRSLGDFLASAFFWPQVLAQMQVHVAEREHAEEHTA